MHLAGNMSLCLLSVSVHKQVRIVQAAHQGSSRHGFKSWPHVQCRGVFGEEQNALRARSVQRVQLWKGLHPSALSEAVSHFTKVHSTHSMSCDECHTQ